MRAGATQLMTFPGDDQPTPVPAGAIAAARARGATFVKKPWAMAALDALPPTASMTGQITGGAIGAPALTMGPAGVLVPASMSVAGAGMGGGVGEWLREKGYQAMGYGDTGTNVGDESRRQAQGSVIGEALGPLAQLVARPFVAHGMGNPRPIPGEPNPVETNINEVRAPTGKVMGLGEPGSSVATASRRASAQAQVSHMGQLRASGNTVDGTAAIDRAYQKLSAEMSDDATGAGQQQLDNMYNDTISRHGRDLPPPRALSLRQRWDKSSAPILRAIERAKSGGPLPDPSVQLKAQWDKALADEMRAEIETTSGAASGVSAESSPARAINRVTQRRIGVERAIKRTEARTPAVSPLVTGLGAAGAGILGGATHGLAGGGAGAVGGALAAHLLSQPEVTSRVGLALTDPYVQMLMRLSPRFAIPQKQQGQ